MSSAADRPESRGRCALITGSTGGLGFAIAEALAAAGYTPVLNGIEPPADLAPRIRELELRCGVAAAYVQADLATADGVAQLVDKARAHAGSIDILVNNAVVRHFAPIEAFPVEAWERALAVNLSAAFHAVRLLLPQMRERGWGRIVNMASIYASRGTTGRVDYVTTKAALLGFTRAVALETVGQGITCNAVCPASVKTPAIEQRVNQIIASGVAPEAAERQFLAGKQPTGRFIAAADVAQLIVFLCSEAGRDITGAMLPVDGGWLAG
jgi:3-hydroxybutyrate dehydrogenase